MSEIKPGYYYGMQFESGQIIMKINELIRNIDNGRIKNIIRYFPENDIHMYILYDRCMIIDDCVDLESLRSGVKNWTQQCEEFNPIFIDIIKEHIPAYKPLNVYKF